MWVVFLFGTLSVESVVLNSFVVTFDTYVFRVLRPMSSVRPHIDTSHGGYRGVRPGPIRSLS